PEPRRPPGVLRHRATEECGVEYHPEGPEGLTSPLRAETNEHNVTALALDVERRRLSLDVLLAKQVAGQQRRARRRVLRQHRPFEPVERREDRRAIAEHLRAVRHSGHDWVSRI